MGSKMKGWSWMEGVVLLGQCSPVLLPSRLFPLLPKGAIQNQGQEGNCPAVLCTFAGNMEQLQQREGSSGLSWQITLNRSHGSEQCPCYPINICLHEELHLEFLPSNALQKQLCPDEAQL